MNKTILITLSALLSFGFAEDPNQMEDFNTTAVESEVERLKEQKKALNEMYSELTEEQKASLDEEFKAEIEELNKKIERLSEEMEG